MAMSVFHRMNLAQRRGMEAAKRGEDRNTNPYLERTGVHAANEMLAWNTGWKKFHEWKLCPLLPIPPLTSAEI